MSRATFTGHEPARDDGLRQFAPERLPTAERERIARDIQKHVEKRNRLDAERAAQASLYRSLA